MSGRRGWLAQFPKRRLCLAKGRPEAALMEERLHWVYGVQAQVALGPAGLPQIKLLRVSEDRRGWEFGAAVFG